MTAGFAAAAAALTAGMMLSAFWRPLSSSRTTSFSPAIGSQAARPDVPDDVGSASPPPEPGLPQAPSARVAMATRVRVVERLAHMVLSSWSRLGVVLGGG
jgi:hypothetical protein